MCLILLAYRVHPDYPIIFAANRDEFYERPALPAHFWEEAPHVLAGRDMKAGGTWCGINVGRSMAAVTNFREPPAEDRSRRSRGELVADFLRYDPPPGRYLSQIEGEADAYAGFNLLLGDAKAMWYFSNREGKVRELEPGVHGLSNHLLDTPWFKVERGRAALDDALANGDVGSDALFDILANEDRAEDDLLPDTGFGRMWERVLSSRFIRTPEYGTRSSTVIIVDRHETVHFHERTFGPGEPADAERAFVLEGRAPAAHSG